MPRRSPRVFHTRTLRVAVLLLLRPAAAFAHAGRAPAPHDAWRAWSTPPLVLLGLALGTVLYLAGLRRLWARAGRGRVVSRWRAGCWLGGLAATALALLSPVDGVARALFAVHMVQHLLLIMVAAPLLVLGEPLLPVLFALPMGARRRIGGAWREAAAPRAVWRWLTRPPVAFTLHVGALAAWHLPRLYDLAERSDVVHAAEHASFVATALLFWWVVAARPVRHRMGTGSAVAYLFGAALASTLFGAAITLAPRPWYTSHWGTTTAWGLTPLEDQQLAGLIMWIPAGIIYLVALGLVLVPVLRRDRARGTPAIDHFALAGPRAP